MVAATRVLHHALQTKYSSCPKLERYTQFGPDLSLFEEDERNILFALVLNFRKLKNHIEDEFTSSKGKATSLYNAETYNLCSLVIGLISTNIFLNRLRSDVSEFQLKVAKISGVLNPNNLLLAMVNASRGFKNCQCSEKYQEAKTMAQETVQKLCEMERSGIVVNPDTKFEVHHHMASFYASECRWKENYKALLELEGLQLSDGNVVNLQILIARAENFVSAGNFQCALERYQKALKTARRIYRPDHHELLRVLQFICGHLQQKGKFYEARIYAKEMLLIAKKQPSTSDFYIRGITDALSIESYFDPQSAEDTLLRLLEDRWPVMFKCIQSGVAGDHLNIDEHVFNESSYNHAAMVLEGVLNCFCVSAYFSVQQKKSTHDKQKGNFYRSAARMLVSIKKKIYGESHIEGIKARYYLDVVHKILGVEEEDSNIQEQFRQYLEGPVNQSYSRPEVDFNVILARE